MCDPSGKVLGRFVPLIDLSEWEPVTPEISEEELDRRERSNERRSTTAEVLWPTWRRLSRKEKP